MPTRTTETARVPEDLSGRERRIPVGGITWRHTFRALRHRNYRLFFWGQLVSLIGTLDAADGDELVRLRNYKFKIFTWSSFCRGLCADGVFVDLGRRAATPPFIMIIAAFNGTAMGFDMPARQAFTVEMTSREDLLNAISLNSSIVNGARVVGPSVAGPMIGAVGVAMCFFLNGLSFVAVITGFLMMRLPPFRRPPHAVSAGEHAWNGLVYSIRHQRVRTILLLFLAVGVFGWSYAVLMPAFARDVLGRGANGYGVLMSASGTGAFVGAADRRNVRASFHAAETRAPWCLDVFGCDAGTFAHEKLSARASVSLRGRIRNAPVFLDIEHGTANDRAG